MSESASFTYFFNLPVREAGKGDETHTHTHVEVARAEADERSKTSDGGWIRDGGAGVSHRDQRGAMGAGAVKPSALNPNALKPGTLIPLTLRP